MSHRLPALLSFPLAVLFAACSLGGALLPSVYAREHPVWAAQGRGQDWVDLVLVAPLICGCAVAALRQSRAARLLLAGLLAYTLYSLVLYAFFIHFGPLFLLYTWALGLAFYALIGIVFALRADDVRSWFGPRTPVRLAGAFAAAIGVAFYALWLSEVVPAIASGTMLKSAADAGLITNPVQVLDLAIVLPAFIVGGVALWRRHPIGYWLCPTMLAFGAVMDAALAAMVVSMRSAGVQSGGPPFTLFVAMAIISVVVLAFLLRHVRTPGRSHAAGAR